MAILWTFENKDKLKPFIKILEENDIDFDLLTKDKAVNPDLGLIVSVGDEDFKKAKKLLLNHRKGISNRHNK